MAGICLEGLDIFPGFEVGGSLEGVGDGGGTLDMPADAGCAASAGDLCLEPGGAKPGEADGEGDGWVGGKIESAPTREGEPAGFLGGFAGVPI